MVDLDQNLAQAFNNEDGKRKWHKQTAGVGSVDGKDGVIIWLGSGEESSKLPKDLLDQRKQWISGFYSRINIPGFIISRQELGRIDGGRLSHMPPASIAWEHLHESQESPLGLLSASNFTRIYDVSLVQERFNAEYICGDYWIGMARFPLPDNWVDPRSFWPGWTHLLHTNNLREAEASFEKFRDEIYEVGSYPADLKSLSKKVSSKLGYLDESALRRLNTEVDSLH